MFKKLMTLALGMAVLFPSLTATQTVQAAEQKTNGLPFSIQINRHALQDPSISSYFSLDVSKHKGETLDLSVVVTNQVEKPITLYGEANYALTSTTGGIDFNAKKDTGLAGFTNEDYAIKENVVGIPEKLELKAKEAKVVNFKVTVLENAKGTYLSAISFTTDGQQVNMDDAKKKKEVMFAVKQQLRFVAAIQLKATNEEVGKAEFTGAEVVNNPNAPYINLDIENKSKMINPDVKGKYEVLKGNEKVFDGQLGSFKMAPATKIKYAIQWQGEFKPGSYVIKLDNGTEIPFKVNNDTVKEAAKNAPKELQIQQGLAWYWIVAITLGILIGLGLIGFLIFFLVRKKKKANQDTNQNDINLD